MIRFPCCCCFSHENSNNETQPLLTSRQSGQNGAASARQTLSAHTDGHTGQRSGKLVMRRVGVADLDHRFSDVAETFNEQQHHFENTVHLLHKLQNRYSCCETLGLFDVLRKIRDEHEDNYRISLRLKGYDFYLCVVPVRSESENEPLPYPLQRAIDGVKDISDSAKATISKGTALQELVGWLIRSKDQMANQVRGAAETFQEQGRLTENLKENMNEMVRAKELSMEYRQKAGQLFIEAANIAGPHL